MVATYNQRTVLLVTLRAWTIFQATIIKLQQPPGGPGSRAPPSKEIRFLDRPQADTILLLRRSPAERRCPGPISYQGFSGQVQRPAQGAGFRREMRPNGLAHAIIYARRENQGFSLDRKTAGTTSTGTEVIAPSSTPTTAIYGT